MKKIILLLTTAILFFLSSKIVYSDSQNINPISCDYYGTEEVFGALPVGAVISAKDPQGVQICQFTVKTNGQYGFISCAADNPNTPQDEGAREGDIITFYVNGVKQKEQATFLSGGIVNLSLGTAAEEGFFNLHLYQMPSYQNYNHDPYYSGPAVADMILDFLDPSNTDTQADLMAYANTNNDGYLSASEMSQVLNDRSPGEYHFSTSLDLEQYAEQGYVDSFDASNQNQVLNQLCHLLAYKVPQTEPGKEFVPVAVATSSDPAIKALSDYGHWMSVVGLKSNQDPFPALSDDHQYPDYYKILDTFQLYGLYLNDPQETGLGFHTYVTADVWMQNYFLPMNTGMEGEGKYMAVMEPMPLTKLPLKIKSSLTSKPLGFLLKVKKPQVSFYIPNWQDEDTNKYLRQIVHILSKSTDFISLFNDKYFEPSLKGTTVNRCYKVADGVNGDYTVIPFDKQQKTKSLVTTAAIIMSNKTGQFRMAFADNNAAKIYAPMSWADAYIQLLKKVGTTEYPINRWLSYVTGKQLYPGWSVITVKEEYQAPFTLYKTKQYAITPDNQIIEGKTSSGIKVIYDKRYEYKKEFVKTIIFEVDSRLKSKVTLDSLYATFRTYLYKANNSQYTLIVIGPQWAGCRLTIQDEQSNGNIRNGGITYLYFR